MKIRRLGILGSVVATAILAGACGGSTPLAGKSHAPMEAMPAPAPAGVAQPRTEAANTESYDRIHENDFVSVADAPLSTFSVDVDTASYSNVRRFLESGEAPPKDGVRIEELINYFAYDYPNPTGDAPFSVNIEVADAPWSKNQLVHIGVQGKRLSNAELPPKNLVFLIDVSGSMSDDNKLPLLKQSLKELVRILDERDRVSLVVYAGASGLVLPPTPASERSKIVAALDELESGGSTNGGEGIELAYRVAHQSFIKGGINRVLLATDGDFNVGTTGRGDLSRLIEQKRKTGVFLSVLGFGTGNYKDAMLETLSAEGNGNFAYIDSPAEARKVLVDEMAATLVTIAKDVKLQVEFNPARIGSYRLIGYENRLLENRDFANDAKDAGDIGAGHSVTALYEITPADAAKTSSDLKYQTARELSPASATSELLTLKLRYKEPLGTQSQLLSFPVSEVTRDPSPNFRFSAAVAAFGMLLRDSEYQGVASFAMVRELGSGARGNDPRGSRSGFLRLVNQAEAELSDAPAPSALAR